jgi:hypothetical protein
VCHAHEPESLLSLPLLAKLAKNLFTRLSSTMADCVNGIVLPSFKNMSEPPGLIPMYLPPSRPWVWMLASLSSGIWLNCGSIRSVTAAL